MSAKIAPIHQEALKGLREHVHDALRAAIVSGKFAPGERLNEREVAAELGVSTTPLKEALRRLEVEGLVVTKPRRGVYITFTPAQAEEMWLARAAIESMVARLAAKRITPQAVKALAACTRDMEDATAAGRASTLMSLNTLFHNTIHEASGCTYLRKLIAGQEMYDLATRKALMSDVGERTRALQEHRAIFDAIRQGDSDAAERVMRDHIIRSGEQHVALAFAPQQKKDLQS